MKKPGDETVKLPPGASSKDSFSKPRAATGEHALNGSNPSLSGVKTLSGQHRALGTEMAPEASQGAWRERVFTPRGVMPKEDVLAGLTTSMRVVMSQANHARVAFEQLRREWLPFLRQALEQVGGDGVDAWLLRAFKPPGRKALDPFLDNLIAAVLVMRAARDLVSLEAASTKAVGVVRQALNVARPHRLSFKVLERELEGKLEIDELLTVFTNDEADLTRRLKDLGNTMESLRGQIVERPGKQPDGMYANFVRLKAEVRVIDAELRRRGAPATP